jgi:hypothetical protein
MEYKGCVVIQGSVNGDILPKIRKSFEGYQLIHSCWDGDDTSHFNESDIVVVNKKPEDVGPGNFYLQRKTTIEGMKMAKELGWNRALKWRSDLWVVGDLWSTFDFNKLNLYFWVKELNGYLCDFFMEGDIDDIITLYDTDIPKWKWNYPEFGITLQMFKNGLDTKVKLMGSELGNGVDIRWEKNDIWFSVHKGIDWYVDVIPVKYDDWLPKRRGIIINPFE